MTIEPGGTPVVGAPPGDGSGLLVSALSRRSLTDDVHESMTALIMDHAIPPHTRINIDQLARQLNVSPTPVREALARLEEASLVRKEPLRGYFTTPLLTRSEFEDLYEFRRLLEPWAAARAAATADEAGRSRLREELRTGADLPGGSDYESYKTLTAHDQRFHSMVLEQAGNQVMQNAFARTHCHLHLFRLFYGRAFASPAIDEHRGVAEAIAAQDPERASAAMLAHIEASYERLKDAAQ
ncbi:GntR family transcriptional regulator [Nocardioides sp.]|jgi:DNA-binding GntR family transcriptional regulator|uniref:GntR family transcriptional regulator n=1 Tax=Nocardioides sp. TaxID=35761 RepID=UPI0031FEDB2F|nr:transcriptional regulator, GntR family [Nocardioides sp.]